MRRERANLRAKMHSCDGQCSFFKRRMTKIHKMNFRFYSVWPVMCDWALKVIRKVSTEVKHEGCFPINLHRTWSFAAAAAIASCWLLKRDRLSSLFTPTSSTRIYIIYRFPLAGSGWSGHPVGCSLFPQQNKNERCHDDLNYYRTWPQDKPLTEEAAEWYLRPPKE